MRKARRFRDLHEGGIVEFLATMFWLFAFGYVLLAAAFYGISSIKAPLIEEETASGEIVMLFPEAVSKAA